MTASRNEFACFDAIALADQIRRKRVSASEVLEAAIVSIDDLNPRLNAVICKLYAQARDQLSALNPEVATMWRSLPREGLIR